MDVPQNFTFALEASLLGPNVHFSDNLSAVDIISRHTSKPGRGYAGPLPMNKFISQIVTGAFGAFQLSG